MVQQSYDEAVAILAYYGLTVDGAQENRIDYAYHTNIIHNPEKVFRDTNLKTTLKTTMKKYIRAGRISKHGLFSSRQS